MSYLLQTKKLHFAKLKAGLFIAASLIASSVFPQQESDITYESCKVLVNSGKSLDLTVSTPPIFKLLPRQNLNVGVEHRLKLDVCNRENRAPGIIGSNMPAGAKLEDNFDGTRTFVWTPDEEGDSTIRFTAYDEADLSIITSVDVRFIVTAAKPNSPPRINHLTNQFGLVGELLSFRVAPTDSDGNVPSVFIVNSPNSASFEDNLDGTRTFRWVPEFPGKYELIFVATDATDSSLQTMKSIIISIEDELPNNRAPYIVQNSDQKIIVGDTLSLRIVPIDPDGVVPNLTVKNFPVGSTFEDNGDGTRNFKWTPTEADIGTRKLIFTATDADDPALQSTQSLMLSVVLSDEEKDTRAPDISLNGESYLDLEVGESYEEYGATAIDNVDGDISDRIIIDDSSLDVTSKGNYFVTYSVQDTAGNDAFATREVSVECDAPFQNLGDENPYLYYKDTCKERWYAAAWLKLGTKKVDRRIAVLNAKLSETEFTLEKRKANLEAALGFIDLYTTSTSLVESLGTGVAEEVFKTGLVLAYDFGTAPIDDGYQKIWVESIKCAAKATLLYKGGATIAANDFFESPSAVLGALSTCAKTPANAVYNALALWDIDNVIEGFNEELIAQYLTDQYYRASRNYDVMAIQIGADNTDMESLIDAAADNLNISDFDWYFLFPSFKQQDYAKTSQLFRKNLQYVETQVSVLQGLKTVELPAELQVPRSPERITNLRGDAYPNEAIDIDGQIYFTASQKYQDLQVFIPRGEVEEPVPLYETNINGPDNARYLTNFNGTLLWQGNDNNGQSRIFGKPPGVSLVKTYCIGSCNEAPLFAQPKVYGNTVAMLVNTDTAANYDLYVLRANASDFVKVRDEFGEAITVRLSAIAQVGDSIYLAKNYQSNEKPILWKYDLNFENPIRMPLSGDLARYVGAATGLFFHFQGEFHFMHSRRSGHTGFNNTLWKWDGIGNPEYIHDLRSGTNSSPNLVVATLDRAYFRASIHGLLQSTDGTLEGVAEINIGELNGIQSMTPSLNELFVRTSRGGLGYNPTVKLYKVKNEGKTADLIYQFKIYTGNERLFREELYIIDDRLRKLDINGVFVEVEIPNFTATRRERLFPGDNNALLFRATDSVYGTELWLIR